MPEFDNWTLKQATEALGEATKGGELGAQAQLFYDGDHWQNSAGWLGQRPDDKNPDAAAIMAEVQKSFVFENAVKGVTDRHIGGVVGREPTFALAPRRALQPDERPSAQELALIALGELAITAEWWDRIGIMRTLRRAARHALLRGRGVLRLYVPMGLRNPNGTVTVAAREGEEPIAAALRLVHLDALDPTASGVAIDDATKRAVGIFRYRDKENKDWAELTYLDDANALTILRVVGEGAEVPPVALDLGGRLLMFELSREPLITAGVLQLQRVINHTRTIISRNVHMAGYRQQSYLNAAPPGYWGDAAGNPVEKTTPGARWIPGTLPGGAGAIHFVQGNPVYDREGSLTGYTSASVAYSDPVDPEGLIAVLANTGEALLHEVHQRHVTMSGDATASGESRKQARAEYEADLGVTGGAINDGGRWVVETGLNFAAALAGNPRQFAAVRPEFAARIDAGPIGADEKRENREDYGAGLLSQEGAMEANGVADVAAELARIKAEEESRQASEDASLLRLSGRQPGQGNDDPPGNPGEEE